MFKVLESNSAVPLVCIPAIVRQNRYMALKKSEKFSMFVKQKT